MSGYPLADAHMAIFLLKPKWEEFAIESAGCEHQVCIFPSGGFN